MKTQVIGCPKTIDGDLKCKEVPASFGFDTACKVILNLIFNIKSFTFLCIKVFVNYETEIIFDEFFIFHVVII